MNRIETSYLIVGAGPVGMLQALLLARQGRECLVVERRAAPQTAPAAHVVNARTFEICRQAGLDMERIEKACKRPEDAGHVRFVTRLAGEEVGCLPFERQGEECLRFTPTPLRNLSQHRFEPILAEAIAGHPRIDLRYGWQWESLEQQAETVTSRIRALDRGETVEIRSQYVIAADGAGSRVRSAIDVEMEGPPRIQSFLMIHFGADLREIVRERPGVLHFVLDPEAGGVFVAHDIDREWVYMHEFDPDQESEADFDDDRCRSLVIRAIGRPVPLDVLHRGTWHMSAQVANAMQRGRVFLTGDAAHRFPPTGGLGLNTGVQDAHNLAWKLAAVEDRIAPPALLDTYERERIPVARENAEQSLQNAVKMALLPQALGTDQERTSRRMQQTLAEPGGRAAVARAIEAQAEHFDMLGLQLGYAYGTGALAREGSAPRPLGSPREFVPSAHPGARLPHAWIERNGVRGSTLDLIEPGRFALISFGDHARWTQAVDAISFLSIRHWRIGEDAVLLDPEWPAICAVGEDGALLVRPDQHVAWRVDGIPADPSDRLARACEQVLQIDGQPSI